MTLSELKWYSSLKQELQQKYSIAVYEISNFAKLIDNTHKHYGHDAGKIIKEFSDLDKLRKDHDFLASNKIPSLQKLLLASKQSTLFFKYK